MTRPTLLVDVDGPLTGGFFEVICRYLRDEGVEAQSHLITQWDVMRSFDVAPRVANRVWRRLRARDVAKKFHPHARAMEFLKWARARARVVAVTSPLDGSPTWAHDRELWLHDQLMFNREDVVSARDKTLVPGVAIVDDRLATVRAWAATHHGGEAILWGESHNARESWDPRASDYDELRGLLTPALGG